MDNEQLRISQIFIAFFAICNALADQNEELLSISTPSPKQVHSPYARRGYLSKSDKMKSSTSEIPKYFISKATPDTNNSQLDYISSFKFSYSNKYHVSQKQDDQKSFSPKQDYKKSDKELIEEATKEVNSIICAAKFQSAEKSKDLPENCAEPLIPTVQRGSAAFFLNAFKGNDDTSLQAAKIALITENVFKRFIKKKGVKNASINLKSLDLRGTALDLKNCDASLVDDLDPYLNYNEPLPDCLKKNVKYRSYDGFCNNLINPIWGRIFTKLRRLLPAAYEDGLFAPRQISITGEPLPCARAVSFHIVDNKVSDQPIWSHLFMQWGQFLDHDITMTPSFTIGPYAQAPECCSKNGKQFEECFPIENCNEKIFAGQNQTCMEFVRSLPGPNKACGFGPRNQMNRITTYIDASNVYGSNKEEAALLREAETGKLKSTTVSTNPRPLLPVNTTEPPNPKICMKQFNKDIPSDRCYFVAGDARVNIVPTLVCLHTLWMREHNRIAEKLKHMGMLNSELIYQETRRIVGAMMQHITYNEFLPIIFGEKLNEYPDLQLLQTGYYYNYSLFLEVSLSNEFSTAAYRVGHTLVNTLMNLYDNSYKKVKPYSNNLMDHFFRPYDIYGDDMLEKYLRGTLSEHAQDTDNSVASALQNFLFKKPSESHGLDLISINIQRGRDHGISPWVEYRKLCKLSVPKDFDDLIDLDIMPASRVQKFISVYKDVKDIDLWPAGVSEHVVKNGAVGETFACILSEQFSRLRRADRFWYENRIPESSGLQHEFSNEQLNELRKSSLARVICDNTEIKTIQSLAMQIGPRVDCNKLPRVNLNAWNPIKPEKLTIKKRRKPSPSRRPSTKQELIDIFNKAYKQT